jgi:hypothetical protein
MELEVGICKVVEVHVLAEHPHKSLPRQSYEYLGEVPRTAVQQCFIEPSLENGPFSVPYDRGHCQFVREPLSLLVLLVHPQGPERIPHKASTTVGLEDCV